MLSWHCPELQKASILLKGFTALSTPTCDYNPQVFPHLHIAGEQPHAFLRAPQRETVIYLCWKGHGCVHEGHFRAWSVTANKQTLAGTGEDKVPGWWDKRTWLLEGK